MWLLWAFVIGAIVGWISSLVQRTSTAEGIMVDILSGCLGAVALALWMNSRSSVDNIAAGIVGASLAVGVVLAVRRLPHRAK